MARGHKTGGRDKGTPNKATTERLERERIAQQAQAEVDKARLANVKLGKEVIEDYMGAFHNIAVVYQNKIARAVTSGQEPSAADLASFERWGGLTAQTAAKLAEFQSPKFKAIAVMAPTPTFVPPAPKEGNVVRLDDANAIARVYARMVKRVR